MDRIARAFFNSLRGLKWAGEHEAAVRQEIVLFAVGLPLAVMLARDLVTFTLLVGSLAILIAVELLNTAIEKLADHVTPEHHPQIGIVKDLGSAAVFMLLVLSAFIWGAALWRFIFG